MSQSCAAQKGLEDIVTSGWCCSFQPLLRVLPTAGSCRAGLDSVPGILTDLWGFLQQSGLLFRSVTCISSFLLHLLYELSLNGRRNAMFSMGELKVLGHLQEIQCAIP